MTKPLVVSIPHNLGKAEARRRLHTGVSQLKAQVGDKFGTVEETWAEDRMSFKVAAMGQTVEGHLDVAEDSVRVEVQLPWILAMMAEKAKGYIQKQGTLMLEKK
jgi:putative polyhydroxyalkanoate system protein